MWYLLLALYDRAQEKKIDKLIAAGRCDDAIEVAMNSGSSSMLAETKRRCAGVSGSSEPSAPSLFTQRTEPALQPPGDEAKVKMWVVSTLDVKGWTYAGYEPLGVYFLANEGPTQTAAHTFTLPVRLDAFDKLPGSMTSTKLIYEGDCTNRRLRIILGEGFTEHSLRGESQVFLDEPNAEWGTAEKDSLAGRLFENFCTLYGPSAAPAGS